jgi:hypothetical protein
MNAACSARTDLAEHASTAGEYVNFMNEYEEDRVRSAYGAEKYARLAEIKSKYDPSNLFHLNANILPARDVGLTHDTLASPMRDAAWPRDP